MSETAASAPGIGRAATFEAFCADPRRVDSVMREVYAKGDRLMCGLIGLHMSLGLAFAAFYDTWLASLTIAAAAGGTFFVSVVLLPRHRLTRAIAGIVLQIFVALHIWQLHGLAEMHFFFFTAFTAMVVYQDGAAMWPGMLFISAQHIVFAVLHNAGVNLNFFEYSFVSIARLSFHFGIAILHVVLCGVWAHSLRSKALLEAFQRECLDASRRKLEEDMGARVAAERALAAKEAEARLGIVASHTSNGVVIADSEGRIEWVNQAFTQFAGQTHEQLTGSNRFDLLYETCTDRAAVARFADAVEAQGEGCAELLLEIQGKPRWLFIQAKRVQVGSLKQLVSVEIDVTARKDAAAELEKARARAEAAARAKGDFLATMSHEMRTPLNGVLGMSEMLARSSLTPRQAEQLETLRTCADNLLALVNDVLDLSKVEAGSIELEDEPFDVRALVDDVLAMNAVRAHAKRIELYAVVARDVPECLLGDTTRTRQTLTNLVANAVKFTPVGEVRIDVRLEQEDSQSPHILFSVRDTGIGIDAATGARLFVPFAQADGSISRRFGGSGLGLSISRRMVEAMGGAIRFESEYGKGSLFTFSLPFRPVAAPPVEPPNAGKLVWVVSPHAGTREALAELLAHRGFRVECRAISELQEGAADLLMIDAAFLQPSLSEPCPVTRGQAVLWLTRAEHEVSAPAQRVLVWPIRSAQLDAGLLALARPDAPAPLTALASHCASWRSVPGTEVLVVEDNPVNQVVARSVLEDLGLTVTIAENGARALETLQRSRFDLVLMDCQMPVMDGFEATRRLRAQEGDGKRTPVIALTAQALSGDEEKCRRAGMDDYLTKPLERRLLVTKLERILCAPLSGLHDVPAPLQSACLPANDAALAVQARSLADERDVAQVEDFVRSFCEQVGAVAVEPIIEAFLTTVPEQMRALRRYAVNDSAEAELKRVAHSLRGATRSMGLTSVADLLQKIEFDVFAERQSRMHVVDVVHERLRRVCEQLAATLCRDAHG